MTFTAGLLLILQACTSSVSDDVSMQAVASRNEGIVILSGQMPQQFILCSTVNMEILRLSGEKAYYELHAVKGAATFNGIAQMKIKAGQYAVTNLVCNIGGHKTVLQKRTKWTEPNRAYARYGTFEVGQGEVVNIGQISIALAGPGRVQLAAAPMTSEQLAWLGENRPKLSARMVTRLFKPARL